MTLTIIVSPIGTEKNSSLRLRNEGTEILMIASIAVDLQLLEVRYKDKLPIYISPGKEVEFNIYYTPLVYGINTAYILIKLNIGKGYLYKAMAHGIDNEFKLRPIVIDTNRLGYSDSIPVYIKNPYSDEVLSITSVQAQDKRIDIKYANDEQMCCTQYQFLNIPPLQRVVAFHVIYSLHSVDNIFSLIRVRCYYNLTITVPILIKGKNELLVLPQVVDFGMVNPTHIPHRIMLTAENYHESALITEVRRKKSPNFVIHLFNYTQKSMLIPKDERTYLLGYIGFYAPTAGFYESEVVFVINSTKLIRLELKARVIETLFLYNTKDIFIDVTNQQSNTSYSYAIPLRDDTNEFVNIINSNINDDEIKTKVACKNSKENKNCLLKSSLVKLSYNSLRKHVYPLKRHITLFVVNTLLHIQLTFYDTSLLCYYTEFTEAQSPKVIKKKCSEIVKLNLGPFGGSTKYIDLHLMNTNPVPINLTELALKNENAFCCLEILTINNEDEGNIFKKWGLGKITSFLDNNVLVIQPGSMAILRLYLSLNECGKTHVAKAIDGDSYSNWLIFSSGKLDTRIKLEYIYRSGDFSFSPSRMRFEPGFPGTIQSKELWAISTFKISLRILRSWTNDKRIEFQQNIEEITSDSKSEIGLVKFIPGNLQEEQHFASLKARILSWSESAITLGELKLWREIQTMWDVISSTGGMQIEAEVFIDTNILQNVKLSVKAELTRPILVRDNELNFQLIQNGSRKEMSFQIYNPSASPMIVQLFNADPSNANYRATLPLNFYPRGKDCTENYTVWTKKYEMTMQQIRSKRRLTSYISFEEFAEDYCCYMGKYNASILYSQKYDELTDNDLSATLAKHCQQKSVTQFSQSNIIKKTMKGIKGQGIWNLVFKETKQSEEPELTIKEDFTFPIKYSQSPLIVSPFTHMTIGPVVYSPSTIGEHTGMIFIKNNLTVLHPIKLRGESGVGTLEFIEETNPLLMFNRMIAVVPKEHFNIRDSAQSTEVEFRLTQTDLLVEMKPNNTGGIWSTFARKFLRSDIYPFRVRKSHLRTYTIRNIGNKPLIVTKISIENRECKAYGIVIQNCNQFVLEPQQAYKIRINYVTSFTIASLKHSLVFHTNSGPQTFDLAIKLPFNIMAALQQIPAFEEYLL